eukprot:gene10628-11753_t
MATRRGGGGLGIGVLLLAAELFGVGLPNIPPVTLGFIAFNSAIYLRLLRLVRDVGKACVSYRLVWHHGQWKRLFLAPFHHLDSMHLYFNMVSFLWKGRTLERRYGARKFFIIIAVFAVLSQLLMLFMNRFLSIFLWNSSYTTTCAAGFSGVIFALKVLTTQNMWQESVSVLGLPFTVPAQFACWIELLLIKILVPNSSLIGHLAGILVGMAFVQGPLHGLVNLIDRFIGSRLGDIAAPTAQNNPANRGSYTYRSGTSGYRNNPNRAQDNEEQQIQEAIRRSLLETNIHSGSTSGASSVRSRQQPPYPAYGWSIPDAGFSSADQYHPPYPPPMAAAGPGFYDQPYGGANSPNSMDENDHNCSRMPNPEDYIQREEGSLYPNLQRVDSTTESIPSAPPIERPELLSVD